MNVYTWGLCWDNLNLRGTPARGSNSPLEYLHAQRPTQLYKDLPLTLGYARTLTWAPVPSPRVGRCISPRSKASLLARETVPKGKLWVSSCARTSQGSPVPGHGLWAPGRAGTSHRTGKLFSRPSWPAHTRPGLTFAAVVSEPPAGLRNVWVRCPSLSLPLWALFLPLGNEVSGVSCHATPKALPDSWSSRPGQAAGVSSET